MENKYIQEYYPENYSQCYGCGTRNAQGLHVQSRWEGDECLCVFDPRPYHTSFPGFVYGGLIASVIDCHSTAAAAGAAYRAEDRPMDSEPPLRFVTASLHVDYLKPTPMGVPLELRSRVKEMKERKVVIATDLLAGGTVCVKGEVVAVKIPASMGGK